MSLKTQVWAKACLLSALLLATGTLLSYRSRAEEIASRRPLSEMPFTIGNWHGRDLPIDPEIREVLGNGDFLSRAYEEKRAVVPVQAFIAYFASQRVGDTIHSPKNCLPGSGWMPIAASYIHLRQSGRIVPATRYLVQSGKDQQVVLYWYQAHNRIVASEYLAKYYLIRDAIRMNRSDGALVRISTEVLPGETVDSAQSRAVEFAEILLGQLSEYIPS